MNGWQLIGRVEAAEPKQIGQRTIHRLTIVGDAKEVNGKLGRAPCVAFDWWGRCPPVGQYVVAAGTFSSWTGKDGTPRSELRCDSLWPLMLVSSDCPRTPAKEEPRHVPEAHVPQATAPKSDDIPF